MALTPLKKILKIAAHRSNFASGVEAAKVCQTFNEFLAKECGPYVASQARATAFRAGRLIVGCQQSVILQQIRMRQAALLTSVQQALPDIKILELYVRLTQSEEFP